MQLVQFKDDIRVERATTEKDEWGREKTEFIYEGKARYQQGGQVYRGLLITNSVLFFPLDIFLKENDIVFITLHNGLVKRGVVGNIRYIEMPLSSDKETRMELKQVQDYDGNG